MMKNFFDQLKQQFSKTKTSDDELELFIGLPSCVIGISEPFENGQLFISIAAVRRDGSTKLRRTYDYQDIVIRHVEDINTAEIAMVIRRYAEQRATFKNRNLEPVELSEAKKRLGLQ